LPGKASGKRANFGRDHGQASVRNKFTWHKWAVRSCWRGVAGMGVTFVADVLSFRLAELKLDSTTVRQYRG
jgi:hypothetical protein